MRTCHCRTALEIRRDFVFVNVSLLFVGDKNHRNISNFNCVSNVENLQAGFFSDGFRFRAFIKTNNYIDAAFFKVECVRVSLATVTDYRDGFAVHNFPVNILVIIRLCQNKLPPKK